MYVAGGFCYPQTNDRVSDRSHPSVYISFERLGGRRPLVKSAEDNSPRISLRLHNNTGALIAVEANSADPTLIPVTLADGGKAYALRESEEVDLCFEAEAVPQITADEFFAIKVPKQIPSYYSCKWRADRRGKRSFWIRSGESVIFSVPREFLAEDLKIYTVFNYEWESEKGQMKADEPVHQVYYYSSDLPYDLKAGFRHSFAGWK